MQIFDASYKRDGTVCNSGKMRTRTVCIRTPTKLKFEDLEI